MKKIIFILCAAATAAVTGGCTKFLDTVPDNRTKIDNIDKVKALLVSAYSDRTAAMILDPRCDGYKDYGATLDGTAPESFMDCTYTAFRWDEYSRSESGNDSNEQFWGGCFSAIAAANHALEAIEKIGYKEEYAPYKGEALLARAYAHFMVLSLYSNMFDLANQAVNPGIPYVTEPETVVIKQYDRETVAATLAKIKADIDEGLRLAGTYADFKQPKFHFTRNSGLALAARFALFTQDYPAVINYVSQLIPQVTEYTKNGSNSDGSPIQIPSASDNAYVFAGNNIYDWVYAAEAYSSGDALGQAFLSPKNNNVLLSSEVVSSLSWGYLGTGLTRYAHAETFGEQLTGENVTGTNWIMPTYSLSNDPVSFTPKYFSDFHYTNITAGIGTLYTKISLFRLEEALLARAEAFAMTKQYQKAYDDLNIYIQNRMKDYTIKGSSLSKDKVVKFYSAQVTDSKSFLNNTFNMGRFSAAATTTEGQLQRALVQTCLDFRYSEYVNEGMRWFDVLRWNIPVTHTLSTGETSTLTPDDDRRVIQLPPTTSLSGLEPNRMTNIPFPW